MKNGTKNGVKKCPSCHDQISEVIYIEEGVKSSWRVTVDSEGEIHFDRIEGAKPVGKVVCPKCYHELSPNYLIYWEDYLKKRQGVN